jgi:hypothetical protein
MNPEFIIALTVQPWLKWFCCPHCGNNYAISKDGRCSFCDEDLVIVSDSVVESDILMECSSNLGMPWVGGSSYYYHTQWTKWISNEIEFDNS